MNLFQNTQKKKHPLFLGRVAKLERSDLEWNCGLKFLLIVQVLIWIYFLHLMTLFRKKYSPAFQSVKACPMLREAMGFLGGSEKMPTWPTSTHRADVHPLLFLFFKKFWRWASRTQFRTYLHSKHAVPQWSVQSNGLITESWLSF